ncbi:MAG: tetratricopeptide repeat protein [Chitinophagaceae bacterium]
MRIYISLIVVFLLICSRDVFSQTTIIDSLKLEIEKEKIDSNKSTLLAYLALEFRTINVDTAIKYANIGRNLAIKSSYLKGEILCGYILGESNRIKGNYAKALDIALNTIQKTENSSFNNMLFNLNNLIATIYGSMSENEKYLQYLRKMYNLTSVVKDDESLNVLYTNLGDVFEKLNILDSARYYTHLAYDISVKLNDVEGIGLTLNNLGNIHLKLNQNEVALANYKMSLPYVAENEEAVSYCEATMGIAKIYYSNGIEDSSLYYANKSFNVAKKKHYAQYILNASEFLAKYYKSKNRIDSSYKYLSEIVIAKDSLFGQEKVKQIQSLELQETVRQREIEEEKLKAENERSKNLQYGIITIVIISLLLLFLLLSNSIIVNNSIIKSLGILSLLLVFEFINLLLHPFISNITHHSPILMLIISVAIAALIIPVHHKLEHILIEMVINKNKITRERKTSTAPLNDRID